MTEDEETRDAFKADQAERPYTELRAAVLEHLRLPTGKTVARLKELTRAPT